jgi:hypothetical protein
MPTSVTSSSLPVSSGNVSSVPPFTLAQSDRPSEFGGFIVPDKWGRLEKFPDGSFKLAVTHSVTKQLVGSAVFYPTTIDGGLGRRPTTAVRIHSIDAASRDDWTQVVSTIAHVAQQNGITVLTADPERESEAANYLHRLGFDHRSGTQSDGRPFSLIRSAADDRNHVIRDIVVPKI